MPAKPAVGLYFNDSFIEVAQVTADGSKPARFNQLPLPSLTVVNGIVKDPGTLLKVLRQLLAQTRPRAIKGEEVVIGVSDNQAFLRVFTVPKSVGKEIEEAIDWQVRSLTPVLPADVETDWQIIGRDPNDQIEVLLAAIPKSVIESYLTVVTAAGLRPVVIEPAVFANIRILNPEQVKGKNQLLVYIGLNYVEATYITGGNPRFSDFIFEADIRKKGTIIDVVKEYVNFANSKFPSRPVAEIIVSGDHPQLEAVISYLVGQKYTAFIGQSRIAAAKKTDQSLLRTAYGLSLKTFVSAPSLNLLPLDFRLEVIRQRLTLTWKAVLSLMIFLTIGGGGLLYQIFSTAQSRAQELTFLKEQHLQELMSAPNQELIKQADQLNTQADLVLLLRQVTGGEESVLAELSANTPEGVSLTGLVYNRVAGSVKLVDPKSVWSITGTAVSRAAVLDFYGRLQGTSAFANGQLYFGSLEKGEALNFRIASQTNQ